MQPRNLIIILGPTASGKSALGVRLAKKFHGVVISADSRQVYRGMDIGTGKITKREMNGVPHFLLDVASPRSQYSVARYVRDVVRVLRTLPTSTPVFLVGGSPFYIDGLTKPNAFSAIPPNPALRRRLANWPTSRLIVRLRKLAPDRLATIDHANRRRLIRAIEIASTKKLPKNSTVPPMRILKLGLQPSQNTLYKNIDRRVDARLRQGMVKEVDQLHANGLSWKKLEAFGLEYRYLSLYLQGKLTKVAAVKQLKKATHHFAKRQMTWWKRDTDIIWIANDNTVRKRVADFLL